MPQLFPHLRQLCDKSPMRNFRRAPVWVAIFGLAIALVVFFQQRRDDDQATGEVADLASLPADAGHSEQPGAAVATTAGSIAEFSDEGDLKCAQTVSDAADIVLKEHNLPDPFQEQESDDDGALAEIRDAQRILASSRDPEHFLVSLLLESPESRAANDATAQVTLLDLGDRASRSGSKLLAWHALRACAAAKPSCPIAHLEQRLLEADRQNAEAWALVATLRYERGDVSGALAAMQGAARAQTSTWYWTETIALIERSLAAQTSMSYEYRMTNAFGSGAVALPSPGLLDMCKAESAANRAWGEACLALGRVRAERNETMLAKLFAYSLREQALTALGDREGAAEVAAERAFVDAERRISGASREPGASMQRLQWALIMSDPVRMHAYLGTVRQFGEDAAPRMFLRQELPPLLKRAGLLEREGTPECVAKYLVGTRRATPGQQVQVADELYISLRSTSTRRQESVRIRPDGKFSLPFVRGTRTADGKTVRPVREVVAAGKTTAQLQREIAAMLSEFERSPEVQVILLSRLPVEELRAEFDKAQKEAAEEASKAR